MSNTSTIKSRSEFGMEDIIRCNLGFAKGSTWRTAYQRNNKANGQKNLRCFPGCKPDVGHQNSFCGRSVRTVFNLQLSPGTDSNLVQERMICFGHFLEDEDDGIEVNAEIPFQELHEKIRTKKNQLREYIRGRLDDIKQGENNCIQASFDFNLDLKGWHYGFLGCKRTRNNFHKFQVYIAIPREVEPEKSIFTICSKVRSPKWRMYCRRRKDPPECSTILDTTYQDWEEFDHVNECIVDDPLRRPLAQLQQQSSTDGSLQLQRSRALSTKSNKAMNGIRRNSAPPTVHHRNKTIKETTTTSQGRKSTGNITLPRKSSKGGGRPTNLTIKRRASDCDLTLDCLSPRANYVRELKQKEQENLAHQEIAVERTTVYPSSEIEEVCMSQPNLDVNELDSSRHHIRRRSEPDLSLCDIGHFLLPMPPALNPNLVADPSNATKPLPVASASETGGSNECGESDKRFELLRAVLKEAEIPVKDSGTEPQGTVPTLVSGKSVPTFMKPLSQRLRSQAKVFLRHCREMKGIAWKVPLHVKWMKRFTPGKVDVYTKYCIFLLNAVKGFVQAVDEFVAKEIDVEDPDNGISLHFFIQSTLRRPLHAFLGHEAKQQQSVEQVNTESLTTSTTVRNAAKATAKSNSRRPKHTKRKPGPRKPPLTLDSTTSTLAQFSEGNQVDVSVTKELSPSKLPSRSCSSTPTGRLLEGTLTDLGGEQLECNNSWSILGMEFKTDEPFANVSTATELAYGLQDDTAANTPTRLSFGSTVFKMGDPLSMFPNSPGFVSGTQTNSVFASNPASPIGLRYSRSGVRTALTSEKRQVKTENFGEESWNPEPDFDWDFDEFLTVQLGRMSIEKQPTN